MFVVLITSIANAQNTTFDFMCVDPVDEAITAMYATEYPPTEFGSVLGDAAIIANQNATVPPLQKSRTDFISAFDNYGLVFTQFNQNANGYVAQYADSAIPDVQIPGGGTSLTNASFKSWVLAIAQTIWHYGHPNYDPLAGELQAIYDADTHPTELGPKTIAAATAAYNVNTNASGTGFLFELDDKSTSFISLITDDGTSTYVLLDDEDNIEANRTYSPNKGILAFGHSTGHNIELDEYKGLVFNIVEALWYAQHPGYVSAEEMARLAESRRVRLLEIEGLDLGGVTVEHDVNGNLEFGDKFDIYYTSQKSHSYSIYFASEGIFIENLTTNEYADLKADIITKRNNLIPTYQEEIAAWFAADTAPVGSAPEWLPYSLNIKANTLNNGTERFAFIVDGLLSAHGVTITRGGAGGTGATVTTFILSKGDGYDVTFDWGAYSTNGFNGSNASPELYRNLVFDVIKAGWKLVNETNNTKRSDWLDQDLDITGNNVELQTYGQPNYDWWIYFNVDGLRIPILSGGVSYDPMFYNKHTVNPHDTYMTEVEFQTLVTFVTYMRDNFDRLKGITGTYNRKVEIENLVDEYGAVIAHIIDNYDGSTHYTFRNNGNSNEYPVQSNWTHDAGTDLGDLSPDSWVKFYAKCRGIILGL